MGLLRHCVRGPHRPPPHQRRRVHTAQSPCRNIWRSTSDTRRNGGTASAPAGAAAGEGASRAADCFASSSAKGAGSNDSSLPISLLCRHCSLSGSAICSDVLPMLSAGVTWGSTSRPRCRPADATLKNGGRRGFAPGRTLQALRTPWSSAAHRRRERRQRCDQAPLHLLRLQLFHAGLYLA